MATLTNWTASLRSGEAPHRDQWAVLGAVRFVLAFIVMAGHSGFLAPPPRWLHPLAVNTHGFGAVLGFFAISGYSIAASLNRNPRRFYYRRLWRIYPVYAVCWLFALVPWLRFGPILHLPGTPYVAPTPLSVLESLFLLQGFLTTVTGPFGPAWSLSIECAYYAIAPAFHKMSDLVLLCLVGVSGASFLLLPRLGLRAEAQQLYGAAALMLLWAWLCGFVYHRHQQRLWAKCLVLLFPIFILIHCTLNRTGMAEIQTYEIAALALLFAPTIPIRTSTARVFGWLGDVSYPLYLSHNCVLILCFLSGITNPLLAWGLSIIVAVVILQCVDYPARAFARGRAAAA